MFLFPILRVGAGVAAYPCYAGRDYRQGPECWNNKPPSLALSLIWWMRNGGEGWKKKRGLMMRKEEKHRVGLYCEKGRNRETLQRRGGLNMVGRLEEGLEGRRERGDRKKGRDIVMSGGGGSGCVLPAASWNKQTAMRQTVLSNRREAGCALDVSLHLSFSKCCFVCSPLNKPPVPQKGAVLYLLLYIITSHSRQACLLL